MSGQIIDPGFFYWLSVLDGLKMFLICVLVSGGIICGSICLIWGFDYNDEKNRRGRKLLIWSVIVAFVMGLGLVFIPSSETLVRMKLAGYVTYENVDKAEDVIKSATDYILDRLGKEKK